MKTFLQIGAFSFCLEVPEGFPIPPNFRKFEIPEVKNTEYTCRIHLTDTLPSPGGKLLAQREDLIVYETAGKENRLIGSRGTDEFYAYYEELSENTAEIFFLAKKAESLKFDTVFTSLFALERKMIERESLILHCAYLCHQEKAILFSAPSETGKSTQAALWEKYRGSTTINGDRALLRKIDGTWNACGWPVCGTSEICHQKDTPVLAIVMLRQGKDNQIQVLSPRQAFTRLYVQITINQWSPSFVEKAIDLISDLIEKVPVYELTCNISEDAVKCLEGCLFPKQPAPEINGGSYE